MEDTKRIFIGRLSDDVKMAIPSPPMLHSRGDLEAGPTLTRPSFGPMSRRLIAGQSASSTTRAALRLEGHSQTVLVRDPLSEAAHVSDGVQEAGLVHDLAQGLVLWLAFQL